MNAPGRAFGIDLAGYSQGGTVSAAAEDGPTGISVTILTNCPLSQAHAGSEEIDRVVRKEATFLAKLLRYPVAVDVPIDLTQLDSKPRYIWELTRRPVDKYLGALAPLADRIGSSVARFKNILNVGGLRAHLGVSLFETYPAGSLFVSKFPHRGYKSGARAHAVLSDLMHRMNIEGAALSHDEFDAAVCAVTAIARHRLEGAALAKVLRLDEPDLPAGYALLKPSNIRIQVERASCDEWMERLAA